MANYINACIRIRPRKPDETGYIECADRVGNKLIATNDYSDQFSAVLGPHSTQHDVFQTCGVQLLDAALEGKNSCLFAYGQTGSGKTFSMYGAEGGKNPAKLDGIVPAICAELFRRKQQLEKRNSVRLTLGASLVEVQGNKVIDLLADSLPDGQQPSLRVRGSEVLGERLEKVHSSRGLTHLIERGMSKRVTSQNMTHAHSSRSHAFLTLMIEKREFVSGQQTNCEISTMYMVDLAGSEKFVSGGDSSTGGGSINAGLLALGKVLTALARKSSFVPYRDSVLTRMLSNVLVGDCQTCVLACINPGLEQFSETRNVLQYAQHTISVAPNMVPKLGIHSKDHHHHNNSDAGSDSCYDSDGGVATSGDPMANDSFDADEGMDRRTEVVETNSFGSIYARFLGDPANPLILYLHGAGPSQGRRSTSRMWIKLMTSFAGTMDHANSKLATDRSSKKPKKKGGASDSKGDASTLAECRYSEGNVSAADGVEELGENSLASMSGNGEKAPLAEKQPSHKDRRSSCDANGASNHPLEPRVSNSNSRGGLSVGDTSSWEEMSEANWENTCGVIDEKSGTKNTEGSSHGLATVSSHAVEAESSDASTAGMHCAARNSGESSKGKKKTVDPSHGASLAAHPANGRLSLEDTAHGSKSKREAQSSGEPAHPRLAARSHSHEKDAPNAAKQPSEGRLAAQMIAKFEGHSVEVRSRGHSHDTGAPAAIKHASDGLRRMSEGNLEDTLAILDEYHADLKTKEEQKRDEHHDAHESTPGGVDGDAPPISTCAEPHAAQQAGKRSRISAKRRGTIGMSRRDQESRTDQESRRGHESPPRDGSLTPGSRSPVSTSRSPVSTPGRETPKGTPRLVRVKVKAADHHRGSVKDKLGVRERKSDGFANSLFVDTEQDDVVDDGHDRVAGMRSQLALLLRARQKELKQMSCSMCLSPLVKPTRLPSCRHVLCAVCVEKTIVYFRECPICSKPMDGPAHVDLYHTEVMRMRLATLNNIPVIVTTEKARLDVMLREKERCNRVVLEFGSEGAMVDGGRTELIFFIQIVPSPEGTEVIRGSHCPISLDGHKVVDYVTINCTPTKPAPVAGEKGYLDAPSSPTHGFCVQSASKKCHITLHWAHELWMAPLQVRYTAHGSTPFRRRIAVQLSPDVTAAGKRGPGNDDGGAPLVYGEDASQSSGWVTYLPGLSGARAQGTILISSRKVKEAKAASAQSSELASRWMDRLAEDTEHVVDEAIGHVRDVQQMLVLGANAMTPLPLLAEDASLGLDKASQGFLMKSVCEGMHPGIVDMYETMLNLVKSDSKGSRLSELFKEKDKNLLRPKNFFQVAIDLPGHGKTPSAPDSLDWSAFLLEVIRALAKQHAYLVVGYGQSASALFNALLTNPKLTSFVAVREPEIDHVDVETLHGILHPVLVACDVEAPLFRSVRQLESALLQISVPKISLTRSPKYFQKEFADEIYAFMDNNGWHGSLPTNGNSKKLPLLTRLAGGIGAWREEAKAASNADPKSPHGPKTPKSPGGSLAKGERRVSIFRAGTEKELLVTPKLTKPMARSGTEKDLLHATPPVTPKSRSMCRSATEKELLSATPPATPKSRLMSRSATEKELLHTAPSAGPNSKPVAAGTLSHGK